MSVYSEQIAFGGILKIDKESWYIQYYFSGPDSRYNGVHVRIEGSEIDDYIKAWQDNYRDYQNLKKKYKGQRYEQSVSCGMTIKIGEFFEGVCLVNNHMPINTNKKLKMVLDSLREAKEKASSMLKIEES